jgi:pimeloyl-ACP methyl ester carboxylesterase
LIHLLALASLAPLQGVRTSAVPARDAPRDSTPYARTLEESGRDNARAAALESAGLSQRSVGGPGIASLGSTTGTVDPLPVLYEVTIPVSGGNEAFLFQETSAVGPRPLLVVFHKFGVGHYDALAHTSFFQEARRRGWYCLAPFGGGQRHFSNLKSQAHTEAALAWARASFSIDATRVYAVGFSMGGGAAMNYAARHLDPTGTMLAAVFNESGILSHEDTYPQLDPSIVPFYDAHFGGGGPAQPFPMQQASVFSFDPVTQIVDLDTDLGRNLLHLGTYSTRTTLDVPYLATQSDLFHTHLLSRGADPLRHRWSVVNYPGHSWDAVTERSVCDWLRTFRLAIPTSGSTLADRDARYFHFDVEQDAPGAFTPFAWSVDEATNAVAVSATSNLAAIAVHSADAGLSPASALTIALDTADGLPDEFRVLDWPALPANVLRDGVATASWTYDALAARVTLLEFDGGAHVWTVVP